MSREQEKWLRQMIQTELDAVTLETGTQERILADIHQQIRKESGFMKRSKKKMVLAIAAAIMVTGTITVVAAGKITGLSSSTNRNDAVFTASELENLAEKKMGDGIFIAESLSDGSTFTEGYVVDVEAMDAEGNIVGTYPEAMASYGENRGITLSIAEPLAEVQAQQDDRQPIAEEEYGGVVLQGQEDHYLFLPPDTKPDEEDLKLQEEGKLFISYGSAEEQRKVFRSVSWTGDDREYLLCTFEDKSLDEVMEMAKGYLDSRE